MKKYVLIILLAYIALIQSCKNEATKNQFKLGVDLPMTGLVSYYGTSAKNGIELAKKQLLASKDFSGVPIDIVYEDNQGQGKQAVVAINKLVSIDKVPVIIGCGTSTETMAASPVANKHKTVLISPVSSASSISDAGPFIFRTCPSDRDQARDLANWIKEQYNKVGIIFVNSTWGTGFKDNFESFFKELNGTITNTISTDPGETNFRTQLSVLKNQSPDAFVFIIYAKEGGALVRQARELGIKQQIFGADPWSQQDFRTGSGSYADGIRYTTPAQYDGQSFKNFRDAYIKEYNTEPDVYASNGYDCMMLLAKKYVEGARTGEEFQNKLSTVTDFQGATGITRFDKNGDVEGKKFGRFVIVNNSPQPVK